MVPGPSTAQNLSSSVTGGSLRGTGLRLALALFSPRLLQADWKACFEAPFGFEHKIDFLRLEGLRSAAPSSGHGGLGRDYPACSIRVLEVNVNLFMAVCVFRKLDYDV